MSNHINIKKVVTISLLSILMTGTLSVKKAISNSSSNFIELKFLAGEFQCSTNAALSEFEMTISAAQNSTPITLQVGETALVEARNLQDLNIDIYAVSGDCINWSTLADPVFMSSKNQFPNYINPAKAIYEQTSLNEFQADLSDSEGFMLMELGGSASQTTIQNTQSAYDWNDIVLVYDLDPEVPMDLDQEVSILAD